jgi:hypothetical protein
MGGEGDGGGEQGEARERVIYRAACVALSACFTWP